jgi:hypothetical protein
MDNKYFTDGTLTLEHKSSGVNLLVRLHIGLGNIIRVQRDIFDYTFRQIKSVAKSSLVFILATWMVFLGVGLCASIFGPNLEQQIYFSRNKIDANDFIRHACRSKSNDEIKSGLNDKLLPDAAQCLGSEVVEFFR